MLLSALFSAAVYRYVSRLKKKGVFDTQRFAMAGLSRRLLILLVVFLVIFSFVFYSSAPASINGRSTRVSKITEPYIPSYSSSTNNKLANNVIAPKLGNETAKAELGRASWKLLHTMMARFPDAPTTDERQALTDYIYLFQRLYPCGECAAHFGEILKQFPPQVSSRSAAAAWACHVHNEVNKSLKKEIFDCANIGDFYDCGCADDDGGEAAPDRSRPEWPEMQQTRKEKIKDNGRDFKQGVTQAEIDAEIERGRRGG